MTEKKTTHTLFYEKTTFKLREYYLRLMDGMYTKNERNELVNEQLPK